MTISGAWIRAVMSWIGGRRLRNLPKFDCRSGISIGELLACVEGDELGVCGHYYYCVI